MAKTPIDDGKPLTPTQDFSQAVEGRVAVKESPPPRPRLTSEQQKSADKVVALEEKENPHAMDVKAAESRLEFNVVGPGQEQSKSVQEPDRSKEPPQTYRSKTSGQEYSTFEGIAAAKAQDQEQGKADIERSEQKGKNHHAPAPTPSYALADSKRGKVGEQAQEQKQKSEADWAQEIREDAKAEARDRAEQKKEKPPEKSSQLSKYAQLLLQANKEQQAMEAGADKSKEREEDRGR